MSSSRQHHLANSREQCLGRTPSHRYAIGAAMRVVAVAGELQNTALTFRRPTVDSTDEAAEGRRSQLAIGMHALYLSPHSASFYS
jgi:hypothetical protein